MGCVGRVGLRHTERFSSVFLVRVGILANDAGELGLDLKGLPRQCKRDEVEQLLLDLRQKFWESHHNLRAGRNESLLGLPPFSFCLVVFPGRGPGLSLSPLTWVRASTRTLLSPVVNIGSSSDSTCGCHALPTCNGGNSSKVSLS